ncbi:hypothetical protein IWZ03DRAFT_169943 [Phyllosticta citriasiana]|uniref:Uncharacterized protein n=1 Tax=Phyllosticta citriasiana TaxID=595635 RepID=A0ABR1KLG5_9PEZI
MPPESVSKATECGRCRRSWWEKPRSLAEGDAAADLYNGRVRVRPQSLSSVPDDKVFWMWLSTVGVYLVTYCTIFGRVQIPGRHFFQRVSDEKYARAAACKCLSRTRGKKSSTSASHRGVTDDGPIPHDGLPKACRALLCSCLFCVGQGP